MDEEEKARQAALMGIQAPGTGAPPAASGGASGSGSSAPRPAASGTGAAGQAGTGFVNFQQRLAANAGQGGAMANKVASGIASEGEGVKHDADAYTRGYENQAAGGGGKSFEQYDPAKYAGLQSRAADVGARANLAAGGGAGFSSQLGRYYSAPGGYTSGQGMLDAALAGAEGGPQLQGLAGAYGGLSSYLTGPHTSVPLPQMPPPSTPSTSAEPDVTQSDKDETAFQKKHPGLGQRGKGADIDESKQQPRAAGARMTGSDLDRFFMRY